jgi:predicted Zn-dependent protease
MMADGEEWCSQVQEKIEAAHGYHELGLHHDAWTVLDDLPPEDKAHPLVVMLRLDILIALDRWDDAVALGTGACRQWPIIDGFFLKTATALMELQDYQKAKLLLLAGPESLHQKAIYWYDLACCQCRTGEVEEAKKSLTKCFSREEVLRMRAPYDPDLEAIWESLGEPPHPRHKG